MAQYPGACRVNVGGLILRLQNHKGNASITAARTLEYSLYCKL